MPVDGGNIEDTRFALDFLKNKVMVEKREKKQIALFIRRNVDMDESNELMKDAMSSINEWNWDIENDEKKIKVLEEHLKQLNET